MEDNASPDVPLFPVELIEERPPPEITYQYFVVAWLGTGGYWKIFPRTYSTVKIARAAADDLLPHYLFRRIYKL